MLVAGILYLGRYKQELIHSELEAMAVQAEMYAAALSTSAVSSSDDATNRVKIEVAREMVRRLVGITGARTRLFATNGSLWPIAAISSRLVRAPFRPKNFQHLAKKTPLPISCANSPMGS